MYPLIVPKNNLTLYSCARYFHPKLSLLQMLPSDISKANFIILVFIYIP